jgi:hypothetical protein
MRRSGFGAQAWLNFANLRRENLRASRLKFGGYGAEDWSLREREISRFARFKKRWKNRRKVF